jgi:hypothetical protein
MKAKKRKTKNAMPKMPKRKEIDVTTLTPFRTLYKNELAMFYAAIAAMKKTD